MHNIGLEGIDTTLHKVFNIQNFQKLKGWQKKVRV